MGLIAEEIENPFGYDANDLPTDSILESIENNTKEIKVETKQRNIQHQYRQ
jgi:predicted membrane chloride channel (bestrophin family)